MSHVVLYRRLEEAAAQLLKLAITILDNVTFDTIVEAKSVKMVQHFLLECVTVCCIYSFDLHHIKVYMN